MSRIAGFCAPVDKPTCGTQRARTRQLIPAVLAAVALFSCGAEAQSPGGAALPRVHVVATGGTIAGGAQGRLDAQNLVALVPELSRAATVDLEDFANLPSSRMTSALQLDLARHVRARCFARTRG